MAAEYVIRNDQERAVVRQMYDATRALYALWQRQLLAAVPTARIVELPGANVFMFLTNEADVPREVRTFAATLDVRWRERGAERDAMSRATRLVDEGAPYSRTAA